MALDVLPETDLRQGSCASNLLRKDFWGYWRMLEDLRGARSKVSVAVSGKVLQEAASAHPEGSSASGTGQRPNARSFLVSNHFTEV